MSAVVRCLLVLTVLLGAAAVTAGQHGGGPVTGRTVAAAELLDTSWGDDYVRPQQ
ncbi:hypothetical protein [Streptomyces sp. NPDC090025]|uniref:hypothetical protein n=1 Tax=Streptomyces sp. NPDC090025 TaxID=3365922 RepID=UPI003839C2A5